MRRKLARCLGVASERRHDHASGTLMTRPSTSCAMISSSVTRTSWMRVSLLAVVFMPCLQDGGSALQDKSPDHVELAGAEALIAREAERLKPELQVLFSRSTCTCGDSLQSKLVKKIRYGPAMPLILGIQ